MKKDPHGSDPVASGDPRPVYERPQVLRLGEVHRGEGGGACDAPGSGDSGLCDRNGFGASMDCQSNGYGASSWGAPGFPGHEGGEVE